MSDMGEEHVCMSDMGGGALSTPYTDTLGNIRVLPSMVSYISLLPRLRSGHSSMHPNSLTVLLVPHNVCIFLHVSAFGIGEPLSTPCTVTLFDVQ